MLFRWIFTFGFTALVCHSEMFEVMDDYGSVLPSNIIRTEHNSTYSACLLSCQNEKNCQRAYFTHAKNEASRKWQEGSCIQTRRDVATDAMDTLSHSKTFEKRCLCRIGDLCQPNDCGQSCKNIILKYPFLMNQSGSYYIKVFDKHHLFYCDMATAGGGWMMIANITIRSNNEAVNIDTYLQSHLEGTEDIFSGKRALNSEALNIIRDATNFTQIRFYCYKPSVNRRIHIVTSAANKNVIDHLTGRTDETPSSCGSYDILSDDTSILAKNCPFWNAAKWSFLYAKRSERLYDHPAFIPAQSHWVMGRDHDGILRWECDDFFEYNSHATGLWQIFVR